MGYADKDGVERVLSRMKYEAGVWARGNKKAIDRWKKNWYKDPHAWTNIWVEGNRVPGTGYFTGHLMVYSITLNIILAAALGYAVYG